MTLFDDPILTVRQVSEYLQISRSKVYYLLSRKQMPCLRLGRNVRIRQSDLKDWLQKRVERAG